MPCVCKNIPYSIFLHTHFRKFGKCRLKPTFSETTSSILCQHDRPIWPKLERHRHNGPTRHDMLATFPAKLQAPCCAAAGMPGNAVDQKTHQNWWVWAHIKAMIAGLIDELVLIVAFFFNIAVIYTAIIGVDLFCHYCQQCHHHFFCQNNCQQLSALLPLLPPITTAGQF